MELTPDDLYRHRDFLHTLALDLVADEHEAEDLVQSALLYALQRPPRTSGALRAWFRKVVRHMAINSVVASRRRREREQRVSAPEATDDSTLSRLEVRMEVLRAVEQLDELYRDPIILYYLEELGTSDVARRLGLPVATVKTRLSRGREQLRERLQRRSVGTGSLGLVALLVPLAEWRGTLWTRLRVPALSGAVVAVVATVVVVAPAFLREAPESAPPPLATTRSHALDGERGRSDPPVALASGEDLVARERATSVTSDPGTRAPGGFAAAAPVDGVPFLVRDIWGRGVADVSLALVPEAGSGGEGPSLWRSDGVGRGRLERPATTSFLRPTGENWVSLYEGVVDPEHPERMAVVVVAEAREVRGRLMDVRGEGVAGGRLRARVELAVPLDASASARRPRVQRTQSGSDGGFVARWPDLPMAAVEVVQPGYRPWRHVGLDFDRPIVLTAVFELGEPWIGRVVDRLGVGVPSAVVSLGTGAVRTQSDGWFRISWTGPNAALRKQGALRVGAPVLQAYAPGIGFGQRVLDSSATSGELELALAHGFADLRGRVVSADGRGRAGVEVWLEDPTFLAYPGTHPLEALEAGRGKSRAVTDSQGLFVHRVLEGREYSVCAREESTGERARATWTAGVGLCRLELRAPERVDLTGCIVTAEGRAASGARVEVVRVESGTPLGRGVLNREERRLAERVSDPSGCFAFDDLDLDRAYLRVWREGFVPHEEALSGRAAVGIELEPGLEVRLRNDLEEERLVRFYRDGDEHPLPVVFPHSTTGWRPSDRSWWVVEPGRTETAVIPAGATRLEVLVERDGRELLEREWALPAPDLEAGIDVTLVP